MSSLSPTSTSSSAAASAASPVPSDALDRGLAHIHWKSWLMYLGAAAAARTLFLHPLTVAMARKRVMTENASLKDVLLWRGGGGMLEKIQFAYRGFGVAVFANVFGETLYFGVLEYVRHVLESHAWFGSVRDSIGGFGAEFSSLVFATPLSVVCHRQMTAGFGVARDVKYGSAAMTTRIVTSNGTELNRLFAGFGVAVTALPAGAIWWGIYAQSKRFAYSHIRSRGENDGSPSDDSSSGSASSMTLQSTRDNPIVNGVCGLGASVLTTVMFNPFNVVRTRIQAAGGGSAVAVSRAIWKNEGASAFLKGAFVSSCSAALEGTITSTVYEYTKWLSDHTTVR